MTCMIGVSFLITRQHDVVVVCCCCLVMVIFYDGVVPCKYCTNGNHV